MTGSTDGPETALHVSDDGREVTLAAGSIPAGRLVFANGTAHLTLRGDPAADVLARAWFEASPPRAKLDGETLSFRYPRIGRPFDWRRRKADVTLSTTIPWEIDLRHGAASVEADLRRLELLGLRIGGGASSVRISLPPPSGAVAISIGGGASHLELLRPAEVPVRLAIKGGASRLALDAQEFRAIGGPVRLQSEGFEANADRYEITVGGGASRLTVRSL